MHIKSLNHKKEVKSIANKKKTKNLTPGTPAPYSGQYSVAGEKREITAVKGKPLPPGTKKGTKYTLVDKTKSKSK